MLHDLDDSYPSGAPLMVPSVTWQVWPLICAVDRVRRKSWRSLLCLSGLSACSCWMLLLSGFSLALPN